MKIFLFLAGLALAMGLVVAAIAWMLFRQPSLPNQVLITNPAVEEIGLPPGSILISIPSITNDGPEVTEIMPSKVWIKDPGIAIAKTNLIILDIMGDPFETGSTMGYLAALDGVPAAYRSQWSREVLNLVSNALNKAAVSVGKQP